MTWAAERGAAAWQHDGTARRHAVARTSDASVVRTGASDTFPRSVPAGTASVFDVAARRPPSPPPRRQDPSGRLDAAETPHPRRGGDHMRRRRGPVGRAVRLTLLATGLMLAAVSVAGFTGRSLAGSGSASQSEPTAEPAAEPAPASAPAPAPATREPTERPAGGERIERPAAAAAPEVTSPTPVTDHDAVAAVGGGYEVRLEIGERAVGETDVGEPTTGGAELTVRISRDGEPLPAAPDGAPVRLVTVREGSLAYQEAASPSATEDGALRFRPNLDPGTYQVLVQLNDRTDTPRVAAFTLELD